MLYAYSEESPGEEGHSRYMLASIPKSDEALSLIRNWAKGTETNSTSGKSTENNLIANSTSCTYIDEQYCVETGDEDYPFFCWHYVEESCPGNGGDDPEWPDDPDENEDDCDDPFGCNNNDPGGEDPPGGNDDPECDEMAIDSDCNDWEEDDPEPCDTEDEYIDTMSEQDVLNQLWLESFGPGTGFDQDDRREMGGWLVEDNNGDLLFEPFPGDLDASICHISGVPPPPDGAAVVIHTHPVFPAERIKVESCIDRFIEEEGIIDPDIRDQMRDQLLQTGLMTWQEPSRYDLIYSETHKITSYYMDGTLIEKYYDGTNNTEAYEVYSRCGY